MHFHIVLMGGTSPRAKIDIELGVETGFCAREMLAVMGDEIQYRVGLLRYADFDI